MENVSRELGVENVCFIAGSDVLRDIHGWKSADRLLAEFCLLFVQRPGEEVNIRGNALAPSLRNRIRRIEAGTSPEIIPGCSWLVTLDPPGISSSELRERIGRREPGLTRFLPGDVLEYALENGLYESKYGNTEKSQTDH